MFRKKAAAMALALVMCFGANVFTFADESYVEAIPFLYDSARAFSEGLAVVGLDGKVCYIDRTGKVVISTDYAMAGDFKNGLASVLQKDGQSGYIDKTGAVVIPFQYSAARDFNEDGVAVVGGIYDALIDKTGKEIVPAGEYAAIGDFCDGLAAVRKVDEDGNDNWGYIDVTGKVVIPPEYDSARDFSDGFAVAGKGDEAYLLDKSGGRVLLPGYPASFTGGIAMIYQDDKISLVDTTGKVLKILEGYESTSKFSENLMVVGKDGKMGYIDKTGTVVIPFEYDSADYFIEGLAAVGKGSVDLTDNETESLPWWKEELPINLKFGYIDKSGNAAVPLEYDIVYNFSEGLAVVGKGTQYNNHRFEGKYGYIDKTGKELVPLKYDYAESFSEGLAAVCLDGKWGYIALTDNVPQPAAAPAPAQYAIAVPTSADVYINGTQVSFDAYNIEDSNYFKLRDLAESLRGTEKQFDVTFDSAANAISLIPNMPYTAAGGEMAKGDGQTKNAALTTSKILLDGEEISLTAYNIGGNNYFKLRDIGRLFDFATDLDEEKNAIMIDTSKPYAP